MPKAFPTNKISSAKDTFQLKAANGTSINTYGMAEINIQIAEENYIFNAIVGEVTTPILGMDFFQTLGKNLIIDPYLQTVSQRQHSISAIEYDTCEDKIKRLVRQYPNILNDNLELKSRFLPLEIKTGMATPVFSKVRPLFGEKKAEIEQEILSWEKEGIIRGVVKPMKCSSPIHSVKNKMVSGEFVVISED